MFKEDVSESSILNWYIFYTKSRAEKIALQSFETQNFDVCLPVIRTWKTWKNRQKKLISSPLFPYYIFIKTSQCRFPLILEEDKIVCYVRSENRPATMKEEDINTIKEMASYFTTLTVSPDIRIGHPVRVMKGALAGCEGIAEMRGKSRFGINIQAFNRFVSVEIEEKNLAII